MRRNRHSSQANEDCLHHLGDVTSETPNFFLQRSDPPFHHFALISVRLLFLFFVCCFLIAILFAVIRIFYKGRLSSFTGANPDSKRLRSPFAIAPFPRSIR
jgi:hypothetical protein